VPGLRRPADSRLQAVAGWLGGGQPGRVAAFAVWASDTTPVDAALREIARAARLAGLVPVAAPLCVGSVRAMLDGRTLLLIARDAEEGWRHALDLALVNSRPHVVLFAGVTMRGVHTIRLRPLSCAALVDLVRPRAWVQSHIRRISHVARRSRGWSWRFEQILLSNGANRVEPSRAVSSTYRQDGQLSARAAEQVHTWAAPTTVPSAPVASPVARWSTPMELARVRRQFAAARTMLASGRHQPAERALRQVMHACARRDEWQDAADGALLLTGLLLERGRVKEAERTIARAGAWIERAHDVQISQQAGLLRAGVLLDQGKASEAASVLETVLASAIGLGSSTLVDAALALVRCLYWQGRYPEAWQRLTLIEAEVRSAARDHARWLVARSRVALGLDRVADAVAAAAQARDGSIAVGEPGLVSAALYACALAQLAAGDRSQADAAAIQAGEAARRAHAPMQQLLARVLRAEIARRHGHRAPAAVLVRRLTTLSSAALPAPVGARVELLRDLLTAMDPAEAATARGELTGLKALPLFAPARPSAWSAAAVSADDIADLLRCCHVAEEDSSVLAALGARIRRKLRACGVGFFAGDRDDPVWTAGEGIRIDKETAVRVLAANQLVLPHPGDRIEAGVPVRYAGRVIGALAATWAPGSLCQHAEVSLLLPVGAAAGAPALSALLAQHTANRDDGSSGLIGVSRSMADVRLQIERAAPAPFAVLVEGESGCGKELVARLLHTHGSRRDRPFCTLNCAALPEELVESELFGHARGAFTGAAGERRGVFEEAHTGTLFLDEIGELSARAQAKLLRAIQEGEIRRIGENVCRRVDVRLVAATNRDLRAEAAGGRFRSDLLYRLDVIRIALPPLRDRREDIPILAEHYWREAAARVGSRATLGAQTLAALSEYDWPGNIRELQNVLAALAVRAGRRGIISPSALPPQLRPDQQPAAWRLDAARRQFDRAFVRMALARTGGQRSRAAEQLGVSRQGLAKLITRLNLDDGGARASGAV
jgi:DNA-binding NtrC family response regulator